MRTRVRGLTVALLGPDGVGKSTLLAGLARSYPAPVRQIYMGMWQGAGRPGHTRLHAVALLPITGSWRSLKRPYFWVLAHLAPADQVRDDVVARIRTHHRMLRGRPAAPPAARSGPAPAPPAILR